MAYPFADLPKNYFGAILADPPWRFSTYSECGRDRCADKHYETPSIDQLFRLPVSSLAAANCALFLWATDPQLPDAFELLNRWGFSYKTVGFYWVKTNKISDGYFTGCGYWTRANPEQCLFGTKGKPRRINRDVRRLIVSRRREHSRKPDCVHERIERLVDGPYLELFARQSRTGWTTWGNERTKFDGAAA